VSLRWSDLRGGVDRCRLALTCCCSPLAPSAAAFVPLVHAANSFDHNLQQPAGGKGEAPDCKDIKDRKDCRHSKAVCSWCESKFGGPAMCADEAQAKYLPPMAFECKGSKREVEVEKKGELFGIVVRLGCLGLGLGRVVAV